MKRAFINFDAGFIDFLQRYRLTIARVAMFIVYFWFGFLKLIGESPASPLASAMVDKTVGATYFDALFYVLAIMECVIGILFLFPKAIRLVFPLLMLHLLIVCAPLVLLPSQVWTGLLVPTLEGQYIIKNILLVALAISIAAAAPPATSAHSKRAKR